MTTIKESHPTPPKNNFHPDYDDNYSDSDDEDFDNGENEEIKSLNVGKMFLKEGFGIFENVFQQGVETWG